MVHAAAAASDAVPGGALQARWWHAGGAPSGAVSGEGRRWEPLCALRARWVRAAGAASDSVPGGALQALVVRHSGALQGWPLTPFRGRTLRLHFRHRLHRHLGRTAVGGQRHEWRFL